MSKLSKEYVSDSDDENSNEVDQVFRAPSDYKKCKHLKKFHKKPNEEVWLIKVPEGLDVGSLKSLPVSLDEKYSSKHDKTATFELGNRKFDISEQLGLDHSNLRLLVPDESGESLLLAATEVKNNKKTKHEDKSKGRSKDEDIHLDRIFTISEIANIPDINYEKLRAPRKDVCKVEGLKMRHFPTGYDAKDYNLQEESDKKEKKHKESAESDASSPSKKKHKKDKKAKKK